MKYLSLLIILLVSLQLHGTVFRLNLNSKKDISKSILEFQRNIKFLSIENHIQLLDDLYAYLHSYFGYIKAFEIKKDKIYLHVNGKNRVLYDDYRDKKYQKKLILSTLKDTLSIPYPKGKNHAKLPVNFDPGRFRNHRFLSSVYGKTKQEITNNLTVVKFLYHRVKFNKQNGAAKALKRVSRDLTALLKKKPSYYWYFRNIGGTFNYRKIKNSTTLSGHAYGIAIDLRLKKPYYWLDERKDYKPGTKKQHTLPYEIIKIFEKHKFIWGGKWYHFDRIHFEYRPEFFYSVN